jgi:hypothetical protein
MGATFNIPTKNTETRRYVKRVKNAGKILEGSSVIDIDDFVTGCKDLGVWNSVVCWPLRSPQNTGTNTVLSLGGLGTYDGTVSNNPTWGVEGLLLSSTTRITTTLPGWGVAPQSMFGVAKTNSDSPTENIIVGGSANHDVRSFQIHCPLGQKTRGIGTSRVTRGSCIWSSDTNLPLNSFAGFSHSQNTGTSGDVFVNGQQQASNFFLNWNDGISGPNMNIIEPEYNPITSNTTISFIMHFPNTSLTGNHINVYNLYKSTLGKGLGLP